MHFLIGGKSEAKREAICGCSCIMLARVGLARETSTCHKTLQNDFYCKILFSIVVLKSSGKFLSHFVTFCGCLFTAWKTRVFCFFFLLQPPKSDYRMRSRMNYQNQSRRLRQITQSRCLIIHDKMRKPNSLIFLL